MPKSKHRHPSKNSLGPMGGHKYHATVRRMKHVRVVDDRAVNVTKPNPKEKVW